MPRLLVGVPGDATEVELEVKDAEGVLLGRSPQGEHDAISALQFPPLRPVVVAGPGVSTVHVAAWSQDDRVTVCDAGSRHGTWLKLPTGRPVQVEGSAPVRLRLSDQPPPTPSLASPVETDCEATEYPHAVIRAIAKWLDGIGVPVEIKHHPRGRGGEFADHPSRLPLASGGELSVIPEQTMDARWDSILQELWQYVQRENARFEIEQTSRAEGMILASSAIRRAHRRVVEAAQRGARLMLVGPSGSGKEGLARAFHSQTGRAGPFVARNCGMLTRELVRAELFGTEAGAFTGATRRILGAVERAHGGTLFLDELGEMPLEVQPALLRFLDRGEFERLGEYGVVRAADVRMVAATNRNLTTALERNEFRVDLWYRVSNDIVEVPPLRERFEDLVAYLKTQTLKDSNETAFGLLSQSAIDILRAHRWDGNFRELQSFSSRMLADPSRPVDADRCRDLLARGTLSRVPRARVGAEPPPADPAHHWARLAEVAAQAFADDVGHAAPQNWDEVKEFVEKYFKPLLFVELGHGPHGDQEDIDANVLARRLGADRGTAARQIERYLQLSTRSAGSVP